MCQTYFYLRNEIHFEGKSWQIVDEIGNVYIKIYIGYNAAIFYQLPGHSIIGHAQ